MRAQYIERQLYSAQYIEYIEYIERELYSAQYIEHGRLHNPDNCYDNIILPRYDIFAEITTYLIYLINILWSSAYMLRIKNHGELQIQLGLFGTSPFDIEQD